MLTTFSKGASPMLSALLVLTLFVAQEDAANIVKGKIVSVEGSTIGIETSNGLVEATATKKSAIEINGKKGDVKSLAVGQEVECVIDKDLDVIKSLLAKGVAQPSKPELFRLVELDAQETTSAPWPSEDGLTIYYCIEGKSDWWIWKASRKSTDATFSNPEKLLPGGNPAITADGKRMLLIQKATAAEPYGIYESILKEDVWTRPKRIQEFPNGSCRPCISGDGLRIYFDVIGWQKPHLFMYSSRKSLDSKWETPRRVPMAGDLENDLGFIFVSKNQKTMLARALTKEMNGTNLMLLRRSDVGEAFGSPSFIWIDGLVLNGNFPRYVEKTKELYFSAKRDAANPNSVGSIWLLKGFDPTMHVKKASSP
jgi:hypothetical protein